MRAQQVFVCIVLAFAWLIPQAGSANAQSAVTAIAFSPEGDVVLAASENQIQTYDWPDITLRQPVKEFPFAKIHDVRFSPDGKFLAVAGGNPGEAGVVQILTWPDLDVVLTRNEYRDTVSAIAWTTNSQQFATVGFGGEVRFNSRDEARPDSTYHGHSKGVTTVCLLNNSQWMVTAGIDQSLHVWNVATGELLRSLNNHSGCVNDLQAVPQQSPLPVVASVANDRTVRFWQPTIGRMVRFVKLDSIPLALDWHPTRPHVAVSTSTGDIIVIDSETTGIVANFNSGRNWQYALAIDPTGEWIVVAGETGLQRFAFPQLSLKSNPD